MESVREWYSTLNRPPVAPPNWVFPVVWTTLYAMIATAGWFIWRMPKGDVRRNLLVLFCVYMAFSWGWSFVFFTAKALLAGVYWILANDLVAVLLIMRAWKPKRIVAYLMLPSLAWTIFAAYLNFSYWQLNKTSEQGIIVFPG
ncbi:MAG TPA: TspO/MBR family protein [Patescibacteria group bacterium]|nr:TspO/MBR family protein [Patescibacteria group bacterium]